MSVTPKATESVLKLVIVALSLALVLALVQRPHSTPPGALLISPASAQGTLEFKDYKYVYTTNSEGDVLHVWSAIGHLGQFSHTYKVAAPK